MNVMSLALIGLGATGVAYIFEPRTRALATVLLFIVGFTLVLLGITRLDRWANGRSRAGTSNREATPDGDASHGGGEPGDTVPIARRELARLEVTAKALEGRAIDLEEETERERRRGDQYQAIFQALFGDHLPPNDAHEYMAQVVYDVIRAQHQAGESTPWVPGGNSHKQNEARAAVRTMLHELPTLLQALAGVPFPPRKSIERRAAIAVPARSWLRLPGVYLVNTMGHVFKQRSRDAAMQAAADFNRLRTADDAPLFLADLFVEASQLTAPSDQRRQEVAAGV